MYVCGYVCMYDVCAYIWRDVVVVVATWLMTAHLYDVWMRVFMTGSGKSHLAKMFRDIEKESHGLCRILCLDDYFLQVCRWVSGVNDDDDDDDDVHTHTYRR